MLVFYIIHQEEVPISGRRRFNFLTKYVVERNKREFSAGLEELKCYLVHDTHPVMIRIETVLQRLLSAAGLDPLEWEIYLMRSAPGRLFQFLRDRIFKFADLPKLHSVMYISSLVLICGCHRYCKRHCLSIRESADI